MKITIFFLCVSIACGAVYAQTPGVSLQAIPNYYGWGWNAIVLQNDLITMATVPSIGGRIMQYDLADMPSIFINSSEFGKTYPPANNNQWHNFGGFKNWPAPQSKWNAGGWPPPPILDYGAYSVDDTVRSVDSASISVSSAVEQWLAPGIQFKRRTAVYDGTSRIRLDQTVVNRSHDSVSWSMWGITQSIVHHEGKTDYQNYWAYFPINPNSRYGTAGAYYPSNSSAWKGKIADGVYGVQYSPDNKKIFGDPDKGWIAYASVSDSIVFVKSFSVVEGATYPDDGARVAVYVAGTNPAYMEVEVTSPVVTLADSGASYTFTEYWSAAKAHSPVLDVDSVGLISERLSYNNDSQTFSASYGIFYEGNAMVVFKNADDSVLDVHGIPHAVSPLAEFHLQDIIAIPQGAASVEIQLRNKKDEFAGILERSAISRLLTGTPKVNNTVVSTFRLDQNYPNPFNGGTVLTFVVPAATAGSLTIYDVMGREVAVLESGPIGAGEHHYRWNPEYEAGGIYFATLRVKEGSQTMKMLYVK